MTEKTRNVCRVLWLLLPAVLLLALWLLIPWITKLGNALPPCGFRTMFGLYCPGCGNTHAVLSLLEGRLLASLRYNPLPLMALLTAAAFYLEVALRLFGRRVRLVPRHQAFWWTVLGLYLTYTAVRNFVPFLSPF